MDDMILDDEIYDKMQQEYDKLNISARALRGTLPFILSEPKSHEQSSTQGDKCTIDKYCHIYAVCYEVSERLKPNGNMYLVMRLRDVLDKARGVVEDILEHRYDTCPEQRYSQDTGREWRDSIWDVYYESVGLIGSDTRDIVLTEYMSLAVTLSCDIR